MTDILLLLAGFVGLLLGGEWLVRGSVSVAQALRVPPAIIGLTLVGFGTSAPELVTSLQAALAGSPGIAVGNVVGSNIGNVLLILGIAALLRPLTVDPAAFRRDGSVLVLATLLCVFAILQGTLGRVAGAAFVAGLAVYLVGTFWQERRRSTPAADVYEAEAELVAMRTNSAVLPALLALAGLVVIIIGARFLVTGAVGLAQLAGISETVIGLTIVAIGTSMPELVTSVIAVRKGQGDVAFGNIVGSNIFNILGILGVTALVQPLVIPAQVIGFDVWVLLGTTLAFVVFSVTGWRVGRREGAALVLAYLAYLTLLLVPL